MEDQRKSQMPLGFLPSNPLEMLANNITAKMHQVQHSVGGIVEQFRFALTCRVAHIHTL